MSLFTGYPFQYHTPTLSPLVAREVESLVFDLTRYYNYVLRNEYGAPFIHTKQWGCIPSTCRALSEALTAFFVICETTDGRIESKLQQNHPHLVDRMENITTTLSAYILSKSYRVHYKASLTQRLSLVAVRLYEIYVRIGDETFRNL